MFMQGAALWARLSASHGYFNKQGYCDGGNTLGAPSGNCHLFPVIWGETGTGFTVSYISPSVPQTHRPLVVLPAVMQHQGCSTVKHTLTCQFLAVPHVFLYICR